MALGNGIRSGNVDLAMYWVDRVLCRKSHVFFVLTSIIRGPCGLSARRKDQASEITGHHDESILLIDNVHEASKHQFEGQIHESLSGLTRIEDCAKDYKNRDDTDGNASEFPPNSSFGNGEGAEKTL